MNAKITLLFPQMNTVQIFNTQCKLLLLGDSQPCHRQQHAGCWLKSLMA